MSQPKLKLIVNEDFIRIDRAIWIDLESLWDGWSAGRAGTAGIAYARTKSLAYGKAAAKLRKLADEAERLAEES